MKSHILILVLFGVALVMAGGNSVLAKDQPAAADSNIPQALQGTPAALLSPKAAKLVSQAGGRERVAVAVAVVRYAVKNRPATALAVLRAVVEAAPEAAPEVVLAAARLDGKYLEEFIQVAVAAAPKYADKVIFSLCKAFPSKFQQIVFAACQGVPQVTPQLLAAVEEAVPGAKTIIDRRLRQQGKMADSSSSIITLVTTSLAEVNAAANLIVTAISSPSVNFIDVVNAILQNQIQLSAGGTIITYNLASIHASNPALEAALTPAAQTAVQNAVTVALANPTSPYSHAVGNLSVAFTVIHPGDTEVVDPSSPHRYFSVP